MSTLRVMPGGRVRPEDLPKGAHGRARCRHCSTEVTPPRRTFCSGRCVVEHKIRTNNSYAKRQLYLRDRGICRLCGLDTKVVAEELWEIRIRQDGAERAVRKAHGIPQNRKLRKRSLGGGLWDMDHVVAVRDGGGGCGLEGLQTLCIPCHRLRTAAQRRARATRSASTP